MESNNSAVGFEPKTSPNQIITDGGRQESTESHTFGTDYESLLLEAICMNDEQRVNKLLKFGVDLNLRAGHFPTVLLHALSFRASPEIIRGLLHHGANVRAIDEDGFSVLHLGIIHGATVGCITELLSCGAEANALTYGGASPLVLALLRKTDLQVVRALIHHGSLVNFIDKKGFTPLMICILSDLPLEYHKLLLQSGADITLANHVRKSALYKVLSSGRKLPLAKLFVKYTLIRTFAGDSGHHFSLNAYRQLRHYNAVACYFDECLLELVKMKTTKVNDQISLLAFVTTKNSNTLSYSENANSQIITQEEKIIANYPIYSDIILPNVAYALERGMLFRKLNEVLVYGRNYDLLKNFGEKVVLNFDCTFTIAKNVSNFDLCNLMLAFSNSNLNKSESCDRIIGLEKDILESFTSISSKKAHSE